MRALMLRSVVVMVVMAGVVLATTGCRDGRRAHGSTAMQRMRFVTDFTVRRQLGRPTVAWHSLSGQDRLTSATPPLHCKHIANYGPATATTACYTHGTNSVSEWQKRSAKTIDEHTTKYAPAPSDAGSDTDRSTTLPLLPEEKPSS